MSESLVIITGSAKGLGKAFAESLLKKGCLVALSDISHFEGLKLLSVLERTFSEERVTFIPCDVRSKEDFEHLWNETERHFGRSVNVLVNNAGVNAFYPTCLDINLYGTMTGVEVAYARMGKGGLIINVGSMAGLLPNDNITANNYYVAKRGVVTLTRVLGGASKNSGIRSSCLCPHYVDTDLFEEAGLRAKVPAKEILSIDRVVQGFNELYDNPEKYNGKALMVSPDTPFATMPIYNWIFILWLVFGSNVMQKIFPKMEIYTTSHQVLLIAVLFGTFAIAFELFLAIFSYIFF